MLTVIDVSNNNGGAIDWHRVKGSGVSGVLLKATEGTGFIDDTFAARRKAADAVGLHIGAYHFAHPDESPVVQAKLFIKVVGKLGKQDFKPVLDMELGEPQPSLVEWIRAFNEEVEKSLGAFPIFYSYNSYITGLHLSKPVGNGLWLASYSRNDGVDHGAAVPAPWKKWNLHQFTSKATVGGVEGPCDLSHAYTYRGLLAHPWLSKV